MKTRIINDNWYFHLEDELYQKTGNPEDRDPLTTFGFFKAGEAVGFAAKVYDHHNWRKVTIPHDYAIELPFDRNARNANGLKPINDCVINENESATSRTNAPHFPIAWYRKTFFITEQGEYVENADTVYGDRNGTAPENKRYFLRFEGVYRDVTVFVNGMYIDRMTCGYLPLTVEITDQLLYGETNSIAVRVDCSQYDGWWYDGAGIYQDVKFIETHGYACHTEDVFIHADTNGDVSFTADVDYIGDATNVAVQITIEKDGENIVTEQENLTFEAGNNHIAHKLTVANPQLWDIDAPHLYTLTFAINGEIEQKVNFGFKDVRLSADEGLFLNGKSRKLNGVCLHGDFAGLGVALPYEILYHKYKVMKEMGVNAVRTAHNPPAAHVPDICDKLGILLMDETRMCSSSAEGCRQLEKLVKRDRNHVCVLMWSIGNEEHSVQGNEWGVRLARSMRRIIEKLTVNPIISYGGNNAGRYHGINKEMDARGVNYIRLLSDTFHPDDYHAEHPHQPIFSSEEMSSLTTRGIYKNDYERGYVDAYGNNMMSWASTPQGYFAFCAKRPYYSGGFAWTGFDYRGEPTPYCGSLLDESQPRNTVSNFGIVDLCGFPKDVYYYYRAWWRPEIPTLHLLPDWNGYEIGEQVRVMCFTNCDEITLYLNDQEIETRKIALCEAPEWTIPYEKGELKVIGRKGDAVLTAIRRSDEKTAALRMQTDVYGDYILATIDAVDRFGDISNNDNGDIALSGQGVEILGVGNGDPASYLRERYHVETQLQPLPAFDGVDKLPVSFARNFVSSYEPKHPRFEDSFRMIWSEPTIEDTTIGEHTFSVEFETDGTYEFVEFPAVLGASRIELDGEEIGITPPGNYLVRCRAYRFHAPIEAGKHVLTVHIKSAKGTPTVLKDAYIGRYTTPTVSHKLFNGRMLVIAKKTKTGTLTATHQNGMTATIDIK